MQIFFLTPNRNMSAGKFVNWKGFLAVFWEHCSFNFKRVERPLKEIIQPPPTPIPPDKILVGLWNKIFLERHTETYIYLLSRCSKKVVLGHQEMMQCKLFFLTPNRNMSAGKFLNWEGFLAVFWEHFSFNFKRVDICKMRGLLSKNL